MKSLVKTISYGTAAAVLRPAVLKKLQPGPLTVLMYHGLVEALPEISDPCLVRASDFEEQMAYLKRHFDVVFLGEALRRVETGGIDGPTAVITFDDGYQSNHDLALPVLERLGLPATIYLATGFLGTDTTIWTGLLQHAFGVTQAQELRWNERTWGLRTREERESCLLDIKAQLKSSRQDHLLETVATIFEQLTGSPEPSVGTSSPYRMLDEESLRRLAQSEMIELGAHTQNHFVLSQVEAATQAEEIRGSKSIVESITSKDCTSFAYPNGQPADFDEDTLGILRDNGFESAVTTVTGLCNPASCSPFHVPRITVDGRSSFSQFKLGLFNIPGRFRNSS